MSKIIDTLNNPFKKERMRSSAQEEIAKIYLKVSDKSKIKNQKRPSKFPWMIAVAALLLALVLLFFKSNIDINIKILGEIPSFAPAENDRFGSVQEKGLYLSKGSELNRYLVRNADFKGDAKSFSKISEEYIVLCNSRGSGWANYEIDLKESLDLTKLDIRYSARGEFGGEYLTVVLVDSDNRTYRAEKDISSNLSKGWQIHTLNFKPMKKAIDIKNITAIRFEFGTLTAGNSSAATIYLKDICVVKTKQVGWR
ncbi:MAG: hypothetical protein WCY36_03845 [Candidatus Omnitrophota bacterium]